MRIRALVILLSGGFLLPSAWAQELEESVASTTVVPVVRESLPIVYELPLAMRRELPELVINMLYFAKEPEDRFVKINGTRAEVDGVLGQDLWLKQVYRDGVALDFRGQLFFLPYR